MANVLIVDDEISLVRNLTSYLSSFGDEFTVKAASTAEEALAVLAAGPIDVLVTDVRLPGMDGIELLRRSFALQPRIKGLVMTAFASPELRRRAISRRSSSVRAVGPVTAVHSVLHPPMLHRHPGEARSLRGTPRSTRTLWQVPVLGGTARAQSDRRRGRPRTLFPTARSEPGTRADSCGTSSSPHTVW